MPKFFKSNKVSPSLFSPSLSPINENFPMRDNFMLKEDGPTTLFVFLPGNIDAYMQGSAEKMPLLKSMSLDFHAIRTLNPAEIPEIQQKGLPRKNFYSSEGSAFVAAKEQFSNHAFVILELSVAKRDMTLMIDNINGNKIPVYNLDIIRHLKGIRGFSKTDEYTPDAGKVYKKTGQSEFLLQEPVKLDPASSPRRPR